ncbi:MAG: hypothetical protein QG611_151, partial [Bacteroidota bacterium]|nr:hypothetical protein [Bacteroidota bacterium]
FLMLLIISFASALYAQTLPDISGVWIQDNVKSDDFYKSFDVKFTITQTPLSIKITEIFFDKEGKEITSLNKSFTPDGKEKSTEEQGGINKESARWLADKKSLETKSTRTVGTDIYGSTTTYSLSENGLVLTVQTTDINPFGPSVKQIFNKKQ